MTTPADDKPCTEDACGRPCVWDDDMGFVVWSQWGDNNEDAPFTCGCDHHEGTKP